MQHHEDEGWEVLSMQRLVASQLLATIEESAAHKMLVYSGNIDEAGEALLVSTSVSTTVKSMPGMSDNSAVSFGCSRQICFTRRQQWKHQQVLLFLRGEQ